MKRLALVLLLFLALAWACGGSKSENKQEDGFTFPDNTAGDSGADVKDDPDTATPDAKTDQAESDSPVDDAPLDDSTPDAVDDLALPDLQPDTTDPTVAISLDAPTEAEYQRGPVTFLWHVDGDVPQQSTISWKVCIEGMDNCIEPSIMESYSKLDDPMGSEQSRLVWASMDDVGKDSAASFVIELRDKDGVLIDSKTSEVFPLYNNPDRDRVTLLTSAINGNNQVRPLVFSATTGFSWDSTVLTVGAGPVAVAFNPGGQAAVTSDQDVNQLSLLAVRGDSSVEVVGQFPLGDLYVEQMHYAPDGGALYLLNYNPTPDGGVYRLDLDPHTGQPLEGAQLVFLSNHYAGNRFGLLPDNEGYIVVEGTQQNPAAGIAITRRRIDGTPWGQTLFAPDGAIPSALAVSPSGDQVLTSYFNLFSEDHKVVLFALHNVDNPDEIASVEATDPADLEWSSDELSALLCEGEGNKVTALGLGGGLALSRGGSLKVGLPLEVISPLWGQKANLFMVGTVSASTGESGVAQYTIEAGNPVHAGTFSLGDGIDVLIYGMAIQP